MVHLIDKSAVVAKIKERINSNNEKAAYYSSGSEHDYLYKVKEAVYKDLLSFINTLEVKEVDLNKEIKDYFDNQPIITRSKGVDYRLIPTGVDIAKHFFELGLKSK